MSLSGAARSSEVLRKAKSFGRKLEAPYIEQFLIIAILSLCARLAQG
jgi:hypothetical protein